MFCVAVVGGIATGKSTVCNYLANKGYVYISADEINRKICSQNEVVIAKIIEKFGNSVIDSTNINDSQLNRNKLREIIFSNEQARVWLENLLHPLIKNEINSLLLNFSKTGTKKVVVEIPLLKNKADYPLIDKIICVATNQDLQEARLMQRWGISSQAAKKIINIQPSDQQKINLADYVIQNDGNLSILYDEINTIDNLQNQNGSIWLEIMITFFLISFLLITLSEQAIHHNILMNDLLNQTINVLS